MHVFWEETVVSKITDSDMGPVEVSQEILDGLKAIPTATVYNAVRNF